MAAKLKNQSKAKTANKKPASMADIEKGQRKQQRMIEGMTKREQLMKWLLVAAVVLILLMLLFFGYATDWLKGLHKDTATTNATPISSSLDSAKTATTGTSGSTGTGSTSTSGKTGTATTNDSTGKNTTSSNTTNSTTSSTTNNTTNTGTTTPTPDPGTTTGSGVTAQVSTGLLNLYANTSAGNGISATLNNASVLGISKSCHTSVLIQVCNFSDSNGNIVTTNNLLGTGLITSVTKNF